VTDEVIPDNLIMINTLINEQYLIKFQNCDILKLSSFARRFVVGLGCIEFDWLWVVDWIGLWIQSFYFAMGWIGLSQSFGGLGWVEEIGPTDNSGAVPTLDH